jgi:hypothetical protein
MVVRQSFVMRRLSPTALFQHKSGETKITASVTRDVAGFRNKNNPNIIQSLNNIFF